MFMLLIKICNDPCFANVRQSLLRTLRALCAADERCRQLAEAQVPEIATCKVELPTSTQREAERRKRLAKVRQVRVTK